MSPLLIVSGVFQEHLEAHTHFSNPLRCSLVKFMGLVSITAKHVDCQVPVVPGRVLPFSILEFMGLVAVHPRDRQHWVCDFLLS